MQHPGLVKRLLFVASAVSFVGALPAGSAGATTPGVVDPTFADHGLAPIAAGFVPTDVHVDSSGRTLVVQSAGGVTIVARRYLADGTPDPSFGTSGAASVDLARPPAEVRSALEPDGSLAIAVGHAQGLDPGSVLRLTPGGTLDATFGIKDLPVDNYAGAVAVTAEPGGFAVATSETASVLVRHYADSGALLAKTGPQPASERTIPSDMATMADGRIVVLGIVKNNPVAPAVTRYLATGQLDTSFNGTGSLVLPTAGDRPDAMHLALGADGSVYVAGTGRDPVCCTPDFSDGLVWKVTPGGQPDADFGDEGVAAVGADTFTRLDGVVVTATGVVASGSALDQVGGTARPLLVGLDAHGDLDPSFGAGGVSVPRLPAQHVSDIERAPDGTIVGHVWQANSTAIGRFEGVASPSGTGYRFVASDGGVFTFGDAGFHGSTGNIALNQPIVGMARTPSGAGYWLVARDGGIFTFGDAGFHGSTGAVHLNRPILGMAATPSGLGYWLVASDGGIFSFGDAGFYGSTGAVPLNAPIAAMLPTPTGHGYWLVATDGGIFAFGDAPYYGSKGGDHIPAPIVGIAPEPAGGYWLVGADGSVYPYGLAPFLGDLEGVALAQPVLGMTPTPDGQGYWLVAGDGGIFSFGDAPFFGSEGGAVLNRPIVAMSA